MLAVTGDAPLTATARRAAPPLWMVWSAVALCLVLVGLPRILGFAPDDPDDYMRLAEVRDLLAGQSWWDVRQYRMDAPFGADMHWSRLVDVPLAAFLAAFRSFLYEPWASVAAMTAVPLVQLALVMALLRALARALGADGWTVLAASLLPLAFPLLLSNFLPLRIDHHGWQALAALAAAFLVVRGRRYDELLAGAVMAAGLTVSLEALPVAALLGAVLAGRYWLSGRRGHDAYLVGLALAGPPLGLLTRPPEIMTRAICDVLSWPHFAAFAAAACVALACRLAPAQDRPLGRLAALVPVALVAAPLIVLPLGACAVNPFAGMDPELRTWWLDRVGEGLPLTAQPWSIAAMLLWTPLIVAAGWRVAWHRAPEARAGWTLLALMALGLAGYSLLVMRAALGAQLLAVPFAAVLVRHFLPRARSLPAAGPRIAATLACLLLATPMAVSAALKPLDSDSPGSTAGTAAPVALAAASRTAQDCEVGRLAALPAAKLFAPLDLGPEILARTGHSVVMSGYHRNQLRMLDVMHAFAGPPAGARAIVRENRADYVVACALPQKLAVYVPESGKSLAAELLAERAPGWLVPVAGFTEGPLRVFRVR